MKPSPKATGNGGPAGAPHVEKGNGAHGRLAAARWAGMTVLAWGAAVALVVFPVLSAYNSLELKLSGRSVDVNLLTSILIAFFAVLIALYLFAQGVKYFGAARDPYAREELLGELRPRMREFRYSLHLLRKSLLALIGLIIVAAFVAIAILAPYLAPFPYEYSPYEKSVPPGGAATAIQTEPTLTPPTYFSSLTTTWTNPAGALFIDSTNASSNNTGDVLTLYNVQVRPIVPAVRALDIGVDYWSEQANTLSIALSWDNGTSWTPEQLMPFRTSDTREFWYLSFGSDHNWNGTVVNSTAFLVRITHVLGSATTVGPVFLNAIQVRTTFVGPVHPWGTNEFGEDMMSGILLGTGVDLQIGLLVIGVALGVGVLLGVVSGYKGGAIDEIMMRFTDMILAVPGLILAMAITAALGRSLENVLIALSLVWWPSYTRLVRGQVLSLREVSYVEAARAVGASPRRVMIRHVLPNTLSPILVAATLDLGTIVLTTAGLSFIGIGAKPTDPEWGMLISIGYTKMVTSGYWWEGLLPGIAIFLFVMAFNLFGDGLRDILDPRLRR